MSKLHSKLESGQNTLIRKLNRYRAAKKQRGMTLLEIIIVLAIIGSIAAGVVILAQRAYSSKNLNDVMNNTNTIRTAMQAVYGGSGSYPKVDTTDTLALTDATVSTDTKTPIGQLVALGQLSSNEAKNTISNDFFDVGGASTGATAATGNAPLKGYVVAINGLDQQQCRSLLSQLANNWDYVQVATGGTTGTYPTAVASIALGAAISGITPATAGTSTAPGKPATINATTGIYRSLAANGNNIITPQQAINACNDDSSNTLILGSR